METEKTKLCQFIKDAEGEDLREILAIMDSKLEKFEVLPVIVIPNDKKLEFTFYEWNNDIKDFRKFGEISLEDQGYISELIKMIPIPNTYSFYGIYKDDIMLYSLKGRLGLPSSELYSNYEIENAEFADSQGNLFTTDNGRILKFTPEGKVIEKNLEKIEPTHLLQLGEHYLIVFFKFGDPQVYLTEDMSEIGIINDNDSGEIIGNAWKLSDNKFISNTEDSCFVWRCDFSKSHGNMYHELARFDFSLETVLSPDTVIGLDIDSKSYIYRIFPSTGRYERVQKIDIGSTLTPLCDSLYKSSGGIYKKGKYGYRKIIHTESKIVKAFKPIDKSTNRLSLDISKRLKVSSDLGSVIVKYISPYIF